MVFDINKEKDFRYIEEGDGLPIIILHGLMGGLSNFNGAITFLKTRDTKF